MGQASQKSDKENPSNEEKLKVLCEEFREIRKELMKLKHELSCKWLQLKFQNEYSIETPGPKQKVIKAFPKRMKKFRKEISVRSAAAKEIWLEMEKENEEKSKEEEGEDEDFEDFEDLTIEFYKILFSHFKDEISRTHLYRATEYFEWKFLDKQSAGIIFVETEKFRVDPEAIKFSELKEKLLLLVDEVTNFDPEKVQIVKMTEMEFEEGWGESEY